MAQVAAWIWMIFVGVTLATLAVVILLGTYYRNESLAKRIFVRHKPDRD